MQAESSTHSLPEGAILGDLKIVRVLGEGGFGITYLARDMREKIDVVIKEYFPNAFAIRGKDSAVSARSSEKKAFKKGLKRFRDEARILSRFNHPSIVKIREYFEMNDTAYIVMEYEEGVDLAHYLKQRSGPISQDEVLGIMMPILEGLKEVHRHNYLHRDIKPGNIIVRREKLPVLIDFGASKELLGDIGKSVTSILTEGYAPLEQYSTDVKQQGPFTDIYAVAAVIYRMITGVVPPSAQTRSYELLQEGRDPLIPLIEHKPAGYDGNFLYAIDRALALKGRDRPQSVEEFQRLLMGVKIDRVEGDAIPTIVDEKRSRSEEPISENVSLKAFFSFDGVIHRLNFLLHIFFSFLIILAASMTLSMTIHSYSVRIKEFGALLSLLMVIFAFWGAFAAIVKRTRDMGKSVPLFVVLSLIPYVNLVLALILLFTPGRYSNEMEREL